MSTYLKNLVAVLLVKFITSENFKKILVDIFVKVRALLAAEEDWYDDAAQGVIQIPTGGHEPRRRGDCCGKGCCYRCPD